MQSRPFVVLLAFALAAPAAAEVPELWGEEAEQFLKTAKVIELKHFKTKGVTQPRRAVLSDGELTARASFKDVEYFKDRVKFDGTVYVNFKDNYRHEIAAYELSRLLGSDLVPPCVQRRIRGDVGALCLWMEDTMTDWDRREKRIEPPDPADWARQMATVELFLQLIYDIDHKNVANLLIDKDFTIYKIDSSRAFRDDSEIPRPERLTRFSRSMLDAMMDLSADEVKATLKKWLTKYEVDGLMDRRDAILELARLRVEALGEEKFSFMRLAVFLRRSECSMRAEPTARTTSFLRLSFRANPRRARRRLMD